MATSKHPSELAFFTETTQGTGPADAAAWASDATRIRHISDSLETSGFKQTTADDLRSQEDVLSQEQKVLGIKGGNEFGFDMYLTGTGVTTNSGQQVASDALLTIMAHCLGGSERGYSTTATGGSSTTVALTSTTGVDEGVFLAIQDNTSPAAAHSGKLYIRKVESLAGLTATLDEALPFAVAAGDIVHACHMYYIDESVLVDTTTGSRTFSWLISKGRIAAADRENWEAHGCKGILASLELSRNQPPKMSIRNMVASFETVEEAAEPTWSGTPFGYAPTAIGPDTTVWLEDYGTTTSTQLHVAEFTLNPGVASTPIDTVTEKQTGMPGRAGYSLGLGDSTVDMLVYPLTQGDWTDFNNQQIKVCRIAKAGTVGKAWAISMPRCEIVETPHGEGVGDGLGHRLMLRALKNTDNASAGNASLWKSRFVIVRA